MNELFLSLWRKFTHQPDLRRVPLPIKEANKRNKPRLLRMWRLRRRAQLRKSAHNRVSTHIKNGNWRG